MNATMIAACGLDCATCPAHLAWKSDDDALRAKTAKEWSEAFHADIKPETVNCSGCQEKTGPKFSHCAHCDIRACAAKKKAENCGSCGDFGDCAKISGFFEYAPEAKARLEAQRANR